MSPPRRTRDVAVVFVSLGLAFAVLVAGALGHRLPAGVNLVLWPVIAFGGAFLVAGRGTLELLGLRRLSGRGGPTAAGGGSGATWGRVATIVIITVATGRMTSDELR